MFGHIYPIMMVTSLTLLWFVSIDAFLGRPNFIVDRHVSTFSEKDSLVPIEMVEMESGSSMEVEGFNFFGDYFGPDNEEEAQDEQTLFEARMSSTEYIPAMGVESIIYTLGTTRALFPCEYDLIFARFPGIYATAIVGEWPKLWKSILEDTTPDYELMDFTSDSSENNSTPLSESEHKMLQIALNHHKERNARPRQDSDVEQSLEVFRKTILGLDKYRINNPSRVASKYTDLLQIALDVTDGWMAAANALEYAGLTIREHVVVSKSKDILDDNDDQDDENPLDSFKNPENDSSKEKSRRNEPPAPAPPAAAADIPILDISGLWTQAAVRLLDLEFTEKNIDTDIDKEKNDVIASTFDQRFFQQIGIDDEGKLRIKDFMLYLLRIASRAVLSRPDTPYICVQMGMSPNKERRMNSAVTKLWEPPISAVRTILMLDFDMNTGSNAFAAKEDSECVRFMISKVKE